MISNKNIVVTGCLQGIGRETLRVLAEHGANVFACAYKQTDEYEAFCKNLSEKSQVSIWPVYFDMMERVKMAFDENGISIPFQQVDVHMDK